MANSVIVKLQLQDELSPELKKAQAELEALAKETLSLDSNLKELKANKKGIIKGAVESDIAEVKKLQKEISALKKQSTEKGAKKTDIKNKILERELKITALINAEIKKQTLLINENKNSEAKKSAQATQTLQKELRSRKKVTESIKSETTAIKSNNTSRLKEDAERRALGTTIVRQIRRLESLAVAYYATTSAYNSTYGAGIKLNRQYQDLTLGLTALTSAGVDVSRNGTLLTGAEKFQALQSVTKDTLKQIKEAATETPATFKEMAGFYQQAIGHAIKSNGAMGTSLAEVSKNTIDLTKRMSNLGAAAGMDMYKVNEEIRSLMSGNASTDSLLAMMIFGSPSEANKAIGEAKKSVNGLRDLFNKVLAPFDALAGVDSYTKNMAKLTNEIETIQKEASKQMFKDFNNSIVDMTEYLKNNGDEVIKSFQDIYSTIKAVIPVVYELGEAFLAYKAIGITAAIMETTAALLSEKAALIAANLVYDITTKKVKILTSAQLLLNKAVLKNRYIAAATLIAASLAIIYNGHKKITEIEKEREKASKGFTGKGILTDMRYDRLIKNMVAAYNNMHAKEKAYLALRDTQYSAYAKKQYDESVATYDKIKNKAIASSNDIFETTKKNAKKTKEEVLKEELEIKLKKAKDKVDNAKALKEQIALQKQLNAAIVKSNPYDALNNKLQEYTAKAKGNKKTLALVDKWYYKELGILNDKAIKDHNEGEANKVESKRQAYSDYIQIVGTEEQKFQDKLVQQMKALRASGTLTAEQLSKALKKLSTVKIDFSFADIKESQSDMLQKQIDLTSATENWGSSLDGVAGKMQNLGKSISALAVKELTSKKQRIDLNDKYAKQSQEITDGETKELHKAGITLAKSYAVKAEAEKAQHQLQTQHTKDEKALKQQQQMAEIAGYGQIAGAVGQMFEQGSKEAKAAMLVQEALAVVNGVATVLNVGTSGDGYTALVRVAAAIGVVANVLSMANIAFGGSSTTSKTPAQTRQEREDKYSSSADGYKDSTKPITDRLDRQIKLLQSIDGMKGTYGSSVAKELEKAVSDNIIAMKSASIKNIGKASGATLYYKTIKGQNSQADSIIKGQNSQADSIIKYYFEKYGKALDTSISNKDFKSGIGYGHSNFSRSTTLHSKLNESYLKEGTNLITFLQQLKQNGDLDKFGITHDKNAYNSKTGKYDAKLDEYDSIMADAQKATSDFVTSTLSGMNSLVDASHSFQDMVDGINGDEAFKKAKLNKAFIKVNSKDGGDLAGYLTTQIKNIQKLENNLSQSDIELLTSQKEEDIVAQSELANSLSTDLQNALNNGAKEALNMKDNITLVAEAMTSSTNNIKSWEDSFKSQSQLVADKAKALNENVSVATTTDELQKLFNTLKGGVGGLTDSEKEFLDSNKALIESNGEVVLSEDKILEQRKSLQKRLDLLKLSGDAEGTLAYNRKLEIAGIYDTNKMLLKSIYAEQDRQKAIADTNTALKSLQGNLSTVQGLRSGISENIRVLSGKRYTKDDITSGILALNNMKTADQAKQVPLVEKMMGEYYADQKGLLQKQYDAMVTANNISRDNARKSAQAQNDSINAFNSINSSIQGLKDFAYNYRVSANPQLANNEFYKNFALLQSAIGSNNSDLVSSLSSKTQSNASAYLGTLSTSSLSPDDRHQANKILASLDSLPKREDKTLVDVDASVNRSTAQIGSFEDVFSYDLARLKEEQINMYSTMDTTLQKSETSIVGEIANLTKEVKDLKAELATIATNTAQTASSTSATAHNTQKPLVEVA